MIETQINSASNNHTDQLGWNFHSLGQTCGQKTIYISVETTYNSLSTITTYTHILCIYKTFSIYYKNQLIRVF